MAWSFPAIALLASLLWIDVPFIRQDEKGCGAASIAMVLQYWEAKGYSLQPSVADPERILKQLYSHADEGILASDVVDYLQKQGFNAIPFSGSWQDLQHHVGKGRPLIAALKARSSGLQFHYVVVAGVDSENNLVLVNDPAERKLLKMSKKSFEERWEVTNRWTLLAVPEK
jgi:predicted double-glycine peptidase